MSFKTPILLIIFNRLDTTIEVFNRLRDQKPKYLFIASDGPRINRADDVEKINAVKNYVLSQINWDCEVKTLFQEENLGCGLGVSTAITWFFNNVTQGIILEDDCVPYPDFFNYCEATLELYKNDERVYEVSGTNFQKGVKRGDASYYFSNYGSIWGWASWARAWKNYDYNLSSYDSFLEDKKIKKIFKDKAQQKYWSKNIKKSKAVDTWDYQWVYTHWFHNGLCIVPNVNLINNIGFNTNGTHTTSEPTWYKLATAGNGVLGEIIHPESIEVNTKADDFLYNNYIKPPSLIVRGVKSIKRRLAFI